MPIKVLRLLYTSGEVVLAQIRLGHTIVTHSYLLLGEELVVIHHSLYVTSFWSVAILHK